ncbi:hypothetical protein FQR65_LT04376 [Abscondita terminalis]|nr:hypothetical protein FQR65_LT04376 [Abscondita terminalis]
MSLKLCFWRICFFTEDVFSAKLLPRYNPWRHLRNGFGDFVNCIKISHSPTVDDVKFFLFSPKNRNRGEEILNFNLSNAKNFNTSLVTKVLVHGFVQSYKNKVLWKMKDAYLQKKTYNVIMVDWHNLSMSFCYPIVADYTEFVGQLTGYLLAKLPAKKVHVIGFSLGAHVAAIGAEMQNPKVLRITGLDPAGHTLIKHKINESCSDNVDIIHTSIAGTAKPIGHADFFVNGGLLQPSCSKTNISCSHKRSVDLYLESITSKVGFRAIMCDSLSNFETDKCINNTVTYMGEPWLLK